MNTVVFSTHKFEKPFLTGAAGDRHELRFLEARLTADTAELAGGAEAVSIFVNDEANEIVINKLAQSGTKFLVLRSAGFNNVDLAAAKKNGIRVARVPAYSPYAVAEHAIALMLALNRKIVRASNRVHDLNFSLDGLTGFDMNGKTVGVVGAGQIGRVVIKILHGFGCRLLVVDEIQDASLVRDFAIEYTTMDRLYEESDIITLHLPLTPGSKHIINKESISKMKKSVMLINTSRGGLINTKDVIQGLKSGIIGYLGLDVYEEESALFFDDHSEEILMDDTISRLLTFRNVLITSHQGFLTDTALANIAESTAFNLDRFEKNEACKNEI
ncbi:MAG: 2-hydroxyacid dehydrogenase [Gemmatimonadaceae bacterium]|nr:2-hydroxyacid dehydrogenase [Chitinophagaceae bacterium]